MTKPPSLVETIFLELRLGVLAARYLPGQTIVNDDVCKVYQCRPPVALDALGALVAEGYLSRHKRGEFTVRIWTREEIVDLFDMRASLEALAAARAAERASDAQIAYLGALLDEASEAATMPRDEIDRITHTNLAFHTEVLKMARVAQLPGMIRTVLPNALHRRIVWAQPGEDVAQSARTHRKIAEAIAERSASMARLLMREDIYASREAVLAAIAELAAHDAPSLCKVQRLTQPLEIDGHTYGLGTREPAIDGRMVAFGAPLS